MTAPSVEKARRCQDTILPWEEAQSCYSFVSSCIYSMLVVVWCNQSAIKAHLLTLANIHTSSSCHSFSWDCIATVSEPKTWFSKVRYLLFTVISHPTPVLVACIVTRPMGVAGGAVRPPGSQPEAGVTLPSMQRHKGTSHTGNAGTNQPPALLYACPWPQEVQVCQTGPYMALLLGFSDTF